MKHFWWKLISVILILGSIIMGFLGEVPRLNILNETIRNLYFHVPLWFAMLVQMGVSCFFSLKYLSSYKLKNDLTASCAAYVGGMFALPGLITGSIWATYTWGKPWVADDPKMQGVMAAMIVYMVYYLLRALIPDMQTKARISAVYNIFAFCMTFVFIMIYPRLAPSSLHPGNGGNPAFGKYDMDNSMRAVFYPACVGWILMSFWLLNILNRYKKLQYKLEHHENLE
ncbi:MAG: cytochrome c biogenesis protein CcsA [Bacteroidetes bacterium]|nr:cytochrome c biogenesis protein CcsA [Bacteroidota bacterium]